MLHVIQEHLEALYGLRCEYSVDDFVIDEERAALLGRVPDSAEALLVAESDGALDVGLYLSPELLRRMDPPALSLERWLEEDLGTLCQAAEGVSHFLYLLHTAALERRVSLLELEAQAEVDKFALCLALTWRSEGRFAFGQLFVRLFERFSLRPALSPAEQWRYEEASRLARTYCRHLMSYARRGQFDRFIADLRHTYRLGAEAKLRHLGSSS